MSVKKHVAHEEQESAGNSAYSREPANLIRFPSHALRTVKPVSERVIPYVHKLPKAYNVWDWNR